MAQPQTAVETFKTKLRNVEGMYARRDGGKLTGRNAASSDGTLSMRVLELQALVFEHDSVTDALDASPSLARRWNRVERRHAGLSV